MRILVPFQGTCEHNTTLWVRRVEPTSGPHNRRSVAGKVAEIFGNCVRGCEEYLGKQSQLRKGFMGVGLHSRVTHYRGCDSEICACLLVFVRSVMGHGLQRSCVELGLEPSQNSSVVVFAGDLSSKYVPLCIYICVYIFRVGCPSHVNQSFSAKT